MRIATISAQWDGMSCAWWDQPNTGGFSAVRSVDNSELTGALLKFTLKNDTNALWALCIVKSGILRVLDRTYHKGVNDQPLIIPIEYPKDDCIQIPADSKIFVAFQSDFPNVSAEVQCSLYIRSCPKFEQYVNNQAGHTALWENQEG